MIIAFTTDHPGAPVGRVTSGDRFPDPEPEEPDLESASGARLIQAGAFAAGAQSRARGMHHGPFGLNGLDFPGPALRALAEARREFGQDYKEGAAVWYAVVAGADRAATGSGTARASSSACFALTSGRAGLRRAGLRCAARACLHGPVGRGRLACRGAGWLVGSRPRGGVQPGRQAAGQRRRLRRASRLRSAIS